MFTQVRSANRRVMPVDGQNHKIIMKVVYLVLEPQYQNALTEAAKTYLKSVSNGDYVTLGVKGGGCSGFQYVWDLKSNWPDVKWTAPIDDVVVVLPSSRISIFLI